MEYQKIINYANQQINHLNSEQKIGLKLTTNQKEDMIIVILDVNQPR